MWLRSKKLALPDPAQALPGRSEAVQPGKRHHVHGRPLQPPFADGLATVQLALGCFWGAERKFWELEGVYTTAVGYVAGFTPNPSYEEVCSGMTGHTEAVLVVYDPAVISLPELLRVFWEAHDPTQGMRQGNDVGTQYRSGIYCPDEAGLKVALASRDAYAQALSAAGHNAAVSTEIALAGPFYYAEEYHQQYLAKNPGGYCGLAGTGVSCPPLPATALS